MIIVMLSSQKWANIIDDRLVDRYNTTYLIWSYSIISFCKGMTAC